MVVVGWGRLEVRPPATEKWRREKIHRSEWMMNKMVEILVILVF